MPRAAGVYLGTGHAGSRPQARGGQGAPRREWPCRRGGCSSSAPSYVRQRYRKQPRRSSSRAGPSGARRRRPVFARWARRCRPCSPSRSFIQGSLREPARRHRRWRRRRQCHRAGIRSARAACATHPAFPGTAPGNCCSRAGELVHLGNEWSRGAVNGLSTE